MVNESSGACLSPPSPSNAAMRNARLTGVPPCQVASGTNFSADLWPINSANGLASKLDMSWMSSSKICRCDRWVRRVETWRGPPTILSYPKSASSKNVLSVLLKPARPEDAQPSLTQAPQSKPSMYCLAVGTAVAHASLGGQTTVPG